MNELPGRVLCSTMVSALMTCHRTPAHLTIVAVVATQRRTAGHGPAHRPLSSLLAERPYSLVEPAPLDDGKLVRPLETLSKSGILKCLSSKRLLMPSVSPCLSDSCQRSSRGVRKSRFSKFEQKPQDVSHGRTERAGFFHQLLLVEIKHWLFQRPQLFRSRVGKTVFFANCSAQLVSVEFVGATSARSPSVCDVEITDSPTVDVRRAFEVWESRSSPPTVTSWCQCTEVSGKPYSPATVTKVTDSSAKVTEELVQMVDDT